MSRAMYLQSIASTASDYRIGEHGVVPISPAHVDTWIKQFRAGVQDPILAEVDHLLKKAYVNRGTVAQFLTGLVRSQNLAGAAPDQFWRNCHFMRIQQGGASQNDLLELFDECLRNELGISITDCDSQNTFIYLDDAIFSGSRVKNDLVTWIKTQAPAAATVHVVVIAAHSGGEWHVESKVRDAATAAGKQIKLTIWRARELLNKTNETSRSDVLWPSVIPTDARAQAYAGALAAAGFQVKLRTGDSVGAAGLFSSPAARTMLETEFLTGGLDVRDRCTHLKDILRPLGFTGLRTFGFGAAVITYRNCPNTAPLVFWAGDPWYPLFARKTNTQTSGGAWFDE